VVKEMKKVALYARVSSDKQDTDLSISAQLRALREYALKNGYQVVREFVDEAESGRSADRPEFREMIAMARRPSHPFEAVLIWKYSRFARSREDSIVYKTLLRKQGVQVISITEPFEDTPSGRLFEAMIESLDEFYSANLGEEIVRGLRESASRGFYVNGYTPYGFRRIKVKDGNKDRVKLELDSSHSQVVAQLFHGVLEGKGLKELGKELTNAGISSPRGKGWGKTTLYHILKNESYTGTLVWGRKSKGRMQSQPVRVEKAWPAIVDKATFERVQAILKERAPSYSHPRRTSSQYLLSGIVHCGICGKALVGQEAKGGRFSYYVCGTLLKKGAGTCSAHYLNANKFEESVINKIKERILTEDNLRQLVFMVNEEMDGAMVEYHTRLSTIEAELIEVKHHLERLYDALETAKLGLEDLAPRIHLLRERQEQLQIARDELQDILANRRVKTADLESVVTYAADLKNLLMQGSIAERKVFIRSFVKEIKVTGEDVLVIYKLPLPPEGIVEDRVGVLSIVQDGSGGWIRTNDLRVMSPTSYHCSTPRHLTYLV
jgi:site-specific DNA recombinase